MLLWAFTQHSAQDRLRSAGGACRPRPVLPELPPAAPSGKEGGGGAVSANLSQVYGGRTECLHETTAEFQPDYVRRACVVPRVELCIRVTLCVTPCVSVYACAAGRFRSIEIHRVSHAHASDGSVCLSLPARGLSSVIICRLAFARTSLSAIPVDTGHLDTGQWSLGAGW